jgi:hypothetical protein
MAEKPEREAEKKARDEDAGEAGIDETVEQMSEVATGDERED